ncbi:chondroitin sulfate proteoglycan 5b isoform X2 [Tachysurus fulvidraco]|uniref:chondroitin sulfate proteoglycan 5b isoform X2 n=1 Tax=Tachysurus fulvidraco TaxID=1234273 RepID=UPI001FEFC350|nr:chondroitin sulfate proteoglycan 5b isoform X2 [Tachysurus fulvidraco]
MKMPCRSFTVLMSSLLLLQLLLYYTHGSSLVSNATQFNSSHAGTSVAGIKAALYAEAMPISSPQNHGLHLRGAEEPGISGQGENRPYDSAEREQAVGGMGAGLPTMSHGKAQLDFKEENPHDDTPRWLAEILQPDGSVLDLNSRSPSHEQSLFLSETHESSPIVKVSFSEPDQHHQLEIPPQEVQGGDPTSWTLTDFYDYLSPDYSTTESNADYDRSTPADMDDENVQQVKKAGSWSPSPEDGASGGYNQSGPAGALDRVENIGCLLGFIRRNGTCQSPCDVYTSYCFNGGQCYVVEGIGAFCRCNIQDYMWNKGTRCESVITEFQVMCIVVSVFSVTLLVLFMVIVVFSKQLHLLKIENSQLRKRSKCRPQSEQLNDNFSLSTVAEGSQANVRNECGSPSNSPHALAYYDNIICQNDATKPEEPVKAPVMEEEEALNIQNSLPPQNENSTISTDDPEESGVTIDLELLLPKEAKTYPETSPPLHYNVFLYKLPKSPKISPGRSRHGNVLPQIRPRRGSEPGYSAISSRTPNPRLGKACTP